MDKNKLIDNILNSILPIFLENIKSEEKENMSEIYKNYFIKKYNSLFSDINDVDEKKLLEILKHLELSAWEGLNVEDKKSLIIEDKKMEEFYVLSNKTFNLALSRLNDDKFITKEEAEKLKNKLLELYETIEPFNKKRVEMDLSEAILDIDYSSGENDNITSLRIGREYKTKFQLKTK